MSVQLAARVGRERQVRSSMTDPRRVASLSQIAQVEREHHSLETKEQTMSRVIKSIKVSRGSSPGVYLVCEIEADSCVRRAGQVGS